MAARFMVPMSYRSVAKSGPARAKIHIEMSPPAMSCASTKVHLACPYLAAQGTNIAAKVVTQKVYAARSQPIGNQVRQDAGSTSVSGSVSLLFILEPYPCGGACSAISVLPMTKRRMRAIGFTTYARRYGIRRMQRNANMKVFTICSEHNKIRLRSGHWADASYFGIDSSDAKTIETACDACLLAALTSFRIQFPLTQSRGQLQL